MTAISDLIARLEAMPLTFPYPIAVRDWSAPVERYGIIIPVSSTGIPAFSLKAREVGR